MLRSISAVFVLVAVFAAAAHAQSSDEARVLRFPTIHGGSIVFSYAGDLYSVASAGGVARKLTTHEGMELFPRFSPDGSKLAFTGQYDGNTEVYVMPAQGGVPTRITYTATLGRDDVTDRMGPNNIVMDWSPDGSEWIIEGHGVDPDIVVDNDPYKEYTGTDQQLLRGIEEILKELPNAQKLPVPPPYPNKSNRK